MCVYADLHFCLFFVGWLSQGFFSLSLSLILFLPPAKQHLLRLMSLAVSLVREICIITFLSLISSVLLYRCFLKVQLFINLNQSMFWGSNTDTVTAHIFNGFVATFLLLQNGACFLELIMLVLFRQVFFCYRECNHEISIVVENINIHFTNTSHWLSVWVNKGKAVTFISPWPYWRPEMR